MFKITKKNRKLPSAEKTGQPHADHSFTVRAQPFRETDQHLPRTWSGDAPQTIQYYKVSSGEAQGQNPQDQNVWSDILNSKSGLSAYISR